MFRQHPCVQEPEKQLFRYKGRTNDLVHVDVDVDLPAVSPCVVLAALLHNIGIVAISSPSIGLTFSCHAGTRQAFA